MSVIWKLLLVSALSSLVQAEFPFDYIVAEEGTIEVRNDIDPTAYRLPEDLESLHYDVEITPYFEAEGKSEAFTFEGIVVLTFKAVKDNIQSFVIQENVKEIDGVSLFTESGAQVLLDETTPFRRIREYHFLEVNLRNGTSLENGDIYKLRVLYVGNINETPLSRGIFRGSYKGDDGKIHWYAASHLQPTNSRQAFPCFDEPGFKAYFDITINRPKNFGPSFSNMRIKKTEESGNRVKEIFYTTPKMSAYLVSIHISEEFTVISDNENVNKSFRIIARPNAKGQGEYALEVGPSITKWLEDYLGIEYYTMGDEMKNDQIAVPDWASGATENWGLVSYRELRLLYEKGETSAADKMSIGTIIAHELAHKWFGNLITCRWWDNVWINEGFASYFEHFAMDGVDKSMQLEDQFNIMYLQSSLSSDSSASTRALEHTVNSPTEVTGHFSGISYSKGASLLLMLKHFLTEATFKKALSYFLVEKSYEHALPENLYENFAKAVKEDNALNAFPNLDIASIIKYWVKEPGSPLINVNVNMDTGVISLTQERFYISSPATSNTQVWPIPLTFTTGNNPTWHNLRPTHVMMEKEMTITKDPGHEWVIFNVQQKGLYRVNYDTHNWEMIAETLLNTPDKIHHLNKAQIVDDVFALMRAEKITYNLGFKIVQFLKSETNYYAWYPAITGYSWYRNRIIHLPDKLRQYDQFLYEQLSAVINHVGYDLDPDEPLTTTLNRFYILSFACNIGHEGCVNNAVQKFNDLKSGKSVDPNVRRHVFCCGLLAGGYTEWKLLYDRRQNGNNQTDGVAMLRALGCTTNDQARKEYLEMILSDDVKAQDRTNAFSYFVMGDRSNAKVALQFLKQKIDEIRQKVILQSNFNSIISTVASYLDEEGLNDMESWLKDNQQSIPEYSTGISAIASARSVMDWGTKNADIVLTAVRGSAATIVPTALILLTALITILIQ